MEKRRKYVLFPIIVFWMAFLKANLVKSDNTLNKELAKRSLSNRLPESNYLFEIVSNEVYKLRKRSVNNETTAFKDNVNTSNESLPKKENTTQEPITQSVRHDMGLITRNTMETMGDKETMEPVTKDYNMMSSVGNLKDKEGIINEDSEIEKRERYRNYLRSLGKLQERQSQDFFFPATAFTNIFGASDDISESNQSGHANVSNEPDNIKESSQPPIPKETKEVVTPDEPGAYFSDPGKPRETTVTGGTETPSNTGQSSNTEGTGEPSSKSLLSASFRLSEITASELPPSEISASPPSEVSVSPPSEVSASPTSIISALPQYLISELPPSLVSALPSIVSALPPDVQKDVPEALETVRVLKGIIPRNLEHTDTTDVTEDGNRSEGLAGGTVELSTFILDMMGYTVPTDLIDVESESTGTINEERSSQQSFDSDLLMNRNPNVPQPEAWIDDGAAVIDDSERPLLINLQMRKTARYLLSRDGGDDSSEEDRVDATPDYDEGQSSEETTDAFLFRGEDYSDEDDSDEFYEDFTLSDSALQRKKLRNVRYRRDAEEESDDEDDETDDEGEDSGSEEEETNMEGEDTGSEGDNGSESNEENENYSSSETLDGENKPARLLFRKSDGVSSRPTRPGIEHIRRKDIILKWDAPKEGGGTIINYLVEVKKEGGKYKSLGTPSARSLEITDLEPDNIYFFSIKAKTKAGLSDPLTIKYHMDDLVPSDSGKGSAYIVGKNEADDKDIPESEVDN